MSPRALVSIVLLAGALTACADGDAITAPFSPAPRASLVPSLSQPPLFFGEGTDPVGDTQQGGGLPVPVPDIVSATAVATDDSLTVTVRYAPGTFTSSGTYRTGTLINFDTDQDPATGNAGNEFAATMLPSTSTWLFRNVGTTVYYWRSVTATAVTDGVRLAIPLSWIGDDEGQLGFTVTSYSVGTSLIHDHLGRTNTLPVTPSVATNLLATEVAVLLSAGTLSADQASGLTDKLGAALASIATANATAAANKLKAFENQVRAFVNSGALTAEQGAMLVVKAEAVRALIGAGTAPPDAP